MCTGYANDIIYTMCYYLCSICGRGLKYTVSLLCTYFGINKTTTGFFGHSKSNLKLLRSMDQYRKTVPKSCQ